MNRFKSLFTLLAILHATVALAGGDGVGNGAGVSEKNIVYAWTQIETYAGACLSSSACRLSDAERALLEKIVSGLPAERANADLIQFGSESASPGFFMLDGQIRIARTGDEVGSPIHFNRDLLYSKTQDGRWESIGVSTATALLIHELGHHQGEKNHTALDLLGAKVQSLVLSYSESVNTWPYFESLWSNLIRFRAPGTFSQFWVWDDHHFIDLTDRIASQLRCPHLHGGRPPSGSAFLGLSWDLDTSRPMSSRSTWMVFRFRTLNKCDVVTTGPLGTSEVRVSVNVKTSFSIETGSRSEIAPEATEIEVKNNGYGIDCRIQSCGFPWRSSF